ncbi:hypothetical protein CLOSTASPAR_01130 [[Clostridium] asparagiforme DSM 15981]|uniref:Uncharacterized protein n=1 Tax=[Clostridium] asparagiforme DSM 15981 TaxID=518636 RepID=C0CVX6_9FIRM|nr:hypothetical protein CLOSTASPAR_01130 [[Clostridium] asparagiforme DSM 15981]
MILYIYFFNVSRSHFPPIMSGGVPHVSSPSSHYTKKADFARGFYPFSGIPLHLSAFNYNL